MQRHLALPVVAGLLLAGCSSQPATDTGLQVVASVYPLAYAAEQIAGPQATVLNLAAPGVEPHDLELSAAQVGQIAEADLVISLPGFQPAVDDAIAQQAKDRSLDAYDGLELVAAAEHADEAGHADATGHAHEGTDPHVWLDPRNMALLGSAIAKRLGTIDPEHAATYRENATAFAQSMTQLHEEFASGLRTCKVRTLVVSHEAFAYLAQAYDLREVGLSGLAPDAEPSPARLRQVADVVKRFGVGTIYYETLVDPKIARTIAEETGARTAELDPLEGLRPGAKGDYLSIMRANLQTLREGQRCS